MVDPSVCRVWQHFALEVNLHILTERNILGVAEVGIWQRLSFILPLVPRTTLPSASRKGRSTVIVR